MNSTPMVTRDVNNLALLFPGVLPLPPDIYAKTSYRISGGRPDTVTFLLDDGLDNDLLYNQVAYTPNLDSIAEFRLQTSSYPAEYGRNSGGSSASPPSPVPPMYTAASLTTSAKIV